MPWLVLSTTLPFDLPRISSRKRRSHRPITISSPIALHSQSMNLGDLNIVGKSDGKAATPDAGTSHLVPSRPGTRTAILRRPAAPLTPVPLDDFALSNGSEEERTRNRPTLAIRTTPLVVVKESEASSTEPTATPRPRFDPMRSLRNSFKGKQPRSEDAGVNGDGYGWKGKEKEASSRNRPELETRESKISSKAREIREWMKGKSGTEIHRTPTNPTTIAVDSTRTRNRVGGIRDLFNGHRNASRNVGEGPKPGQTYEIIEHHIIENNPERTVEISTWREHAERKAGGEDDETMSIYYISADEYGHEGKFANTRSQPKRGGGEDNPRQGIARKNSKGSPLQEPDSMGRKGQTAFNDSRGHRSEQGRRRTTIPKSQKENTGFRGNGHGPFSSVRSRATEGNKPFSEGTPPVSQPPIPFPNGTHPPRTRTRGRYKQSTPIEKELPDPPFHPTRSGSTISSIKSEATIQFESFLASCEPSLVHVAPLLRRLGIRRVGHLKAIARLTPPTRDREVKEDAFRQGMTVMEWAILVDKISTL
ncbi:hypothetical protein M413DRAFT_28042 [Hebeloma cylindrosporum]|uniref:Uncharacterized protein n=1 Tax=Hebeloma cylindrosporum TaxID=76867 RepID=A0A0C3BWD7_HEBCY|nr:hypothetical protein M413DRAFT_28042 [Hebeloma cylindrosporum h7]